MNNNFIRNIPRLAGLLAVVFLGAASAQGQFHGAAIIKNPVGPDGTWRAHVGDRITATITVINFDDFQDTLTLTNIVDIVHHASGDIISPNLLPFVPLTLDPYLVSGGTNQISVTNIYTVLPGDGTNNPDGFLLDDARTWGRDNHDGSGGTHIAQTFFLTYPGETFVVRPCLQVRTSCAAGTNGTIAYIGSVSNCGNTLLTNLVVSNFFNGTFGQVLGPTSLDTNQVIAFTNSFLASIPCQPTSAAFWVWGTDELGLTISNSASATCSVINTNPPALTCPTNKTVDYASAWSFDAPTVGPNATLAVASTVTNIAGGTSFTATRTWTATDSCSNNASCTQIVTVVGPPLPAAPNLVNVSLISNVFSLSFLSQTGVTYILEKNDALGETNWFPLLTIPGAGERVDVQQATTGASNRYYRVRIP